MSLSSTDFHEKVEQLQEELSKAQTSLTAEKKCIPVNMIAAGATPFLICTVLFFLSPKFVKVRDGDKYNRSMKKVLTWTILLSILVWVCIYLFTYYKSYER